MSRKPWKPNRRERRILLVLMSGAGGLSGYPIARAAQVGSGYVYVALARLQHHGWVTSEWADGPELRRRFYRLTLDGRRNALECLGLKRATCVH